ncbi:hypothetical protein [Magnetovibrio sp.]|uniref:hypothetical protein n=1 Tax=Magnetovibrio sp. TaxID=2024836 RepID=UPI002F93C268
MTYSTDELTAIQDLPNFLRTEHCYNDMQHAMLVILFRHGLKALQRGQDGISRNVIDNISLYLYIHFLNEEEGLAYKVTNGLLQREKLQDHSELHIRFLDYWRDKVLMPYKTETVEREQTIEELTKFYNLIIKHIDSEDIPTYGSQSVAVEHTRAELARIARTNMPMSPFMAGAYSAVQAMDAVVAKTLDKARLSPRALEPLAALDLVPNVGRVLAGQVGSLRDRFASATRGDLSATSNGGVIYAA